MALKSLLREAIERMPESMKIDSLANYFQKQGVKPLEIEQSGIIERTREVAERAKNTDAVADMDFFAADTGTSIDDWQGSRAPRRGLLRLEETRPDRTGMRQSGQFQGSYSSYTLPDTNQSTYVERVYTNAASAAKGSQHFPDPDYVFHVRGDYLDNYKMNKPVGLLQDEFDFYLRKKGLDPNNVSVELSLTEFKNYTKESFGLTDEEADEALKQYLDWMKDYESTGFNLATRILIEDPNKPRAFRIQEIQSDVYNKQLAEVADFTITRENFAHVVDSAIPPLMPEDILGITGQPYGISPDLVNKTEVKNYFTSFYDISEDQAASLADQTIDALKNKRPMQYPRELTQILRKNQLQKVYNLSEENAERALRDYQNGNARIDISNPTPVEEMSYDQLENNILDFARRNPDIVKREIGKDYTDIPEDELVDYLVELIDGLMKPYFKEELGLTTVQASTLYSRVMANLEDFISNRSNLDFSNTSKLTEIEFKIPYIRQALYHELDAAQEQGLQEVHIAIRPEGVENLARAEGVQKNYETTIRNTAKKIAKQIGAKIEEKNGYLIIGLPAAGFSLPLYAQEPGEENVAQLAEDKDASFIRSAVGRGISEEQARDALFIRRATERGFTREQAQAALDQRKSQGIAAQPAQLTTPPLDESITPPEDFTPLGPPIEAMAAEEEAVDPLLEPRRPGESLGAYNYRINAGPRLRALRERGELATRLVNNLKETVEVYKPWLHMSSIWNEEARMTFETYNAEVAQTVVELAQAREVPLSYRDGHYYITGNDGKEYLADPSILQELWGNKFEIGGAIAGGIAGGAIAGGRVGLSAPLPHPLLRLGAGLGGSIFGAAAGSVAGTELDYMLAAIETNEAMQGRIAFEKALGAAQASVTYDLLFMGSGYLIAKLGGAAWRGMRAAYEHVVNGNKTGAKDALLTTLNITPEQADEQIRLWERLNEAKAPGRDQTEKMLAVLPTTSSGGEAILYNVAKKDPKASAAIKQEVNQRAQSLLDEVKKIHSDEAAENVLKGIRSYLNDTKVFYSVVKDQLTEVDPQLVKPLDIRPQIEDIFNQTLSELRPEQAQTADWLIRQMEDLTMSSENITSARALLDIRKRLTGLRNSSVIRNEEVLHKVNAVVGSVDSHISQLAKDAFGETEGKAWIENWKEANKAYSKMLTVQRNGLFRALTKETTAGKPITPKTIARALVRYGPSIDENYLLKGGKPVNTYREVIDSLDIGTIKEVEGIIVEELTEKYAAGNLGGLRAIQFPELAQELAMYEFRSADAQRIQTVVEELGKLYKNDVMISRFTGGITLEAFQHYLTTNPIVRLQFEMASQVFNYAGQLTGGSKSDMKALVNWVAKLHENPLNAKTVSQLLEATKQDQELKAAIEAYQKEFAKAQAEGTASASPRVAAFKDPSGKLYLKDGPKRKRVDPIMGRSIAKADYVKALFAIDKINAETLTKTRKAQLINKGFEAIVLDDGQVIKLF